MSLYQKFVEKEALHLCVFVLQATVDFDVLYTIPDDSIADFTGSRGYEALDDDQQMLIDIEQNIANLERSMATDSWQAAQKSDKSPKRDRTDRKRSSALKSVRNLIRFGKQRPPKDSDDEENAALMEDIDNCKMKHPAESESVPMSRAGSQTSLASNAESVASLSLIEKNRKTSR